METINKNTGNTDMNNASDNDNIFYMNAYSGPAPSSSPGSAQAPVPDPSMTLSEHFRLMEFTRSGTATRHRIDNTPSSLQVQRLQHLCARTLEPLRRRFGAIRITSGYRCPRLNRLVGGQPGSQHTLGEAADIHTGGPETTQKMFEYLRDHLPYDQLILERRPGVYWIHVSLRSDRPGNRHEAFTLRKK